MNQRAFAAVALGAIITGMSGLLIKGMTIPATSMAFIRTMIPTVFMGLYIARYGLSFLSRNRPFLLKVSILNTARMYLFFLAYLYASIGNAVVMLYTWPIFATIFGSLLLDENITRRHLGLLTMAFFGIIIVNLNKDFDWGGDDLIGMISAISCAALYALMMVIFKRDGKGYELQEIIFYQNFLPSLFFLPFFVVNPFPTTIDWTLAGAHGLFVGVIAYYLFFYGLRYLKASTHSMITYLEIVSAITLGFFCLGESLSVYTILGGIMIVSSTLFLKSN